MVDPLIKVFQSAIAFHQQGKLLEAKKCYEKILTNNPNHFDALHLSGVLAFQSRRFDEAEAFYAKAIRINSNFAPLYSNLGNTLKDLKRFDEGLASYDKAISIETDNADAFYNRGIILHEMKRFDQALGSYDKAILIKSDFADAFNNRGITLQEQKQFDQALGSYDKAILIKSDFVSAFNNRGVALRELKRLDEALASFDKAISIKSDYAEAFKNRGNVLKDLKRFDEALASYDKAIFIKSDDDEAFTNRGNALQDLKRFDEALASYDKAFLLNPDCEWLLGLWLHIKMQTSEWSNFEQNLGKLQYKLGDMKSVTSPFPVLSLFDDLELNLRAAQQWIDKKFQSNSLNMRFVNSCFKTKIRIGYFSADFHNHATAYLMAELFERHDRNNFEIYAFSFGPNADDEMRQRLAISFDKFIDVRFQSDQEVTQLARSLGIDIAIDLKGFTEGARTGIFVDRCAPIQINYIGYPGTMVADYIDYIVADRILIPVESQKFYREKIIYMPDSYQINDSYRKISNKKFTRLDFDLPEDKFIFCCFNNSYKILPEIFESWMRILMSVENSALWLLDDNNTSTQNIRQEATNRGISHERLIFRKRIDLLRKSVAYFDHQFAAPGHSVGLFKMA